MRETWRRIGQAALVLLVTAVVGVADTSNNNNPPPGTLELRRRPGFGAGPETITEVGGCNVPRTQPGVGHR